MRPKKGKSKSKSKPVKPDKRKESDNPNLKRIIKKSLRTFSMLGAIVGLLLSLVLLFVVVSLPGSLKTISNGQIGYVYTEMGDLYDTTVSLQQTINASGKITNKTANSLDSLASELKALDLNVSELTNLSYQIRTNQAGVQNVSMDLSRLSSDLKLHQNSLEAMRTKVDGMIDSLFWILLLLGVGLLLLFSSTLFDALAGVI